MAKPHSPFATVRTTVETLRVNRRRFVYTTALAAGAVLTRLTPASAGPKLKSPNEKLNIACIGVGGGWRAEADVFGMADLDVNKAAANENIMALCDVDATHLNIMAGYFPRAGRYSDYRVMLEKEKSIDAVCIAIPDHQHAPATMLAMSLGKHVYCEKPLTHTVWEARQIMLAARKYGVMTQMGNQGHSGDGNRQLCEMIWAGAIGPVREVHCWTDRPVFIDGNPGWVQGHTRPTGSDPVPKTLDWDLWLGPAAQRPYLATWPNDGRPVYLPHVWRGWWDFGCGSIGDMACHIMDGADWALKLGAPTKVELVAVSKNTTVDMPPWSSIIKFHFPQRGDMVPCTLTWYDGGAKPEKPAEMEAATMETNGALYIGDKGKIVGGEYGENPHLLPESLMAEYKRPDPTIPRVPGGMQGHHKNFILACKGGPPACSNFDVSAPFTEMALLGNLAVRVGKTIEWDSENLRCPNAPEADAFIKPTYRDGWGWKV
jgi:predicted dehydrogenase